MVEWRKLVETNRLQIMVLTSYVVVVLEQNAS